MKYRPRPKRGAQHFICKYKRASRYDPTDVVTACATIKPIWHTSEDSTRITCPLCRRMMLPPGETP